MIDREIKNTGERKREREMEYKDKIIDVGFLTILPFAILAKILPFPKCELSIGVCVPMCVCVYVDICMYFCSSRVPRRASPLVIISQF